MSDSETAASSCCGGASSRIRRAGNLLVGRNLLAPAGDATTCPVMPGTPVDTTAAEAAGLFRDYRGRRYWFCCRGCGPRFDRDPDKYAGAA